MTVLALEDARFLMTPDGGRLAYHETGRGQQPVVWLHGLPLDSRAWAAQRDHFDERYRNVFVDLRGYGASSKLPQGTRGVTDLYVSDTVLLVEALGLREPHLVGFASAGHVALRLAASGRVRLGRLAVLNASPRFRRGEDWPDGFTDAGIAHFTDAAAAGIDALTDAVLDRDLVFRDLDAAAAADLGATFAAMSRNAGVDTLLGFFDDISRDDDRGLLARIDVPTLVMASTLGQEVPAGVGLHLRTVIPDARLVELPGADHFAFATRPLLFNAVLDAFLTASTARVGPSDKRTS
jgi:pimeloyl-ACP methyl ester carboxylesterase